LTRNSLERRERWSGGVKRMLPACCLLLHGREGVTLIASSKCKKNMGSDWISTEPKKTIPILHQKKDVVLRECILALGDIFWYLYYIFIRMAKI
jgi:hypothetical protein